MAAAPSKNRKERPEGKEPKKVEQGSLDQPDPQQGCKWNGQRDEPLQVPLRAGNLLVGQAYDESGKGEEKYHQGASQKEAWRDRSALVSKVAFQVRHGLPGDVGVGK